MTRAIAAICIALLMLLYVGMNGALAQHQHPPQHSAIHETFYSDWYRPDDRRYSCCNKKDCEPVEARKINGTWHVLRDADKKWLPVPATQIETERDSPDGRNHACFQPPGMSDTVFCFIAGAGG